MFRFFKRYFRTVGFRGLLKAIGAKATHSKVLFGVTRKDVRFPFYLRINSSDIPTYEDLFLEQAYNFSVARSPQTIVDAGANIGLASIYFANRWPQAKIIAIEPEESNFKLLKKNVAPYGNVSPVNAALWSQPGEIAIIDTGLGNWAFMTQAQDAFDIADGKTGRKIRALTMDQVIDDYQLDKIDILKIDIEGAEKEVFDDTSSWIGKVDAMVVELHEHMKPGCLRSFYNGSNGFDNEWKQGENVYLARGMCLEQSQSYPSGNGIFRPPDGKVRRATRPAG